MANTAELMTIASSGDFSNRVNFVAIKTALNVSNEDASTDHHAERVKLANEVLSGRLNPVHLALMVMTNTTIAAAADVADLGASVPDGDIEFQLASIWTALAVARSS